MIPRGAVADADAIYTDVWTSMGQEAETATRKQAFAAYQVNGDLMSAAPDHARVLHCLPAVRGEEITDEVIDGPQSDVIAQAGNRMHAQKGLLVWLLGRQWIDSECLGRLLLMLSAEKDLFLRPLLLGQIVVYDRRLYASILRSAHTYA